MNIRDRVQRKLNGINISTHTLVVTSRHISHQGAMLNAAELSP